MDLSKPGGLLRNPEAAVAGSDGRAPGGGRCEASSEWAQVSDWRRRPTPFLKPAREAGEQEATVATNIGTVVAHERTLVKDLTVTVVLRRDWRCRLGLRLMQLGERLAGVQLRVTWEGQAHGRHD